MTGTHAICRQLASAALAVMAVALMLAASKPVHAGDYSHQCRSSGGYYAMNDEELQAFDVAKGREKGKSIPYKVLRKIELSKNAGYCISNKAPKGARRFAYEGITYALHIRFRQDGETIKLFMLCNRASSGLPAGYDCDRDVKTLDWVAK